MQIVDTNNYYPFGMNHLRDDAPSNFGQGSYKNYKFQEQELQETGFYSFKWRNYMPDVGRFFNVDPLSEKYAYQSHYNFSENRVVDAVELEGLEAYILFGSEKRALTNFGQQYNGKSIKQGVEYGTNVYKTIASDGKTYYYYEEPNKGTAASVKLPSTFLNDGERVSTVHTHGEYLEKYDNANFSPQDKENADKRGVDNNVVTPDGSLKNYDVKTKKVTTLSTDMPSDPKDPNRRNKINPVENPKPVKTKPIKPKKVDVDTSGNNIKYEHGRIM